MNVSLRSRKEGPGLHPSCCHGVREMLGTRTGQSITVTLLSGFWPHLYPPTHTVWGKKPASDIPLILAGQPGDSWRSSLMQLDHFGISPTVRQEIASLDSLVN